MNDQRTEIMHGDCLEVLPTLPERSVDLVFGSPPYCDARTYDDGTLPPGHVVSRSCADWVEWMLAVTEAALRVSRGPVVWVAAGVTRERNYWPACEGLMWEWFRRGGHAYRPCYWHRVGIPGSGGDQWFRADVEYVMGFKREGKLPWTDNTAMGHAPKWAPGGEMSHRLTDGTKVSQWGHVSKSGRGRRADGTHKKGGSPSHETVTAKEYRRKRSAAGEREEQLYAAPVKANPGTLAKVPAECVPELDDWNPGTLLRTAAGGGHLGDMLCHENEAPFPEKLAEWFIRSLCPEGGTVLDPFSGSGTTAKVAAVTGRNAIAIDVRKSQVELTTKRVNADAAKVRELF